MPSKPPPLFPVRGKRSVLPFEVLFAVVALLTLGLGIAAGGDDPAYKATLLNLGYVFVALTIFGLGLRWVFRLVGLDIAVIMDKGDNNAIAAAILCAGLVLGVAHVVGSVLH